MKKITVTVLILAMMFSLIACQGTSTPAPASASGAQASEEADDSIDPTGKTPEQLAAEIKEKLGWPSKDITIGITHSPGGDTDYNARLLIKALEKVLDVSVVPNNMSGSSGNIALTYYKDVKADGHTFVAGNSSTMPCNFTTGLSEITHNDFAPVAIYGKQGGECIVVRADSPYMTLNELMDAAKAKPNTIKLGVASGGINSILATIIEEEYGIQFAYNEAGDASVKIPALLGGHIDATIISYAAIKDYTTTGEFRVLSSLLAEKPDLLTGIQTTTELGYPILLANINYYVVAPKDEDPKIVEAFNMLINAVVNNDAEYKQEINAYNFQEPFSLNVEETKAEFDKQLEGYSVYKPFFE